MLDFIEYLKKEKIVDKLLDNYLPDLDHSGTVASINEILEKLENEGEKIRRRKKSESSKQNHDLIGFFYEKGLDETTRKTGGEFYTPKKVVDYILDGIGYIPMKEIRNKKLIDISCGSGSFLIEAIKRIVSSFNLEIISFIEAEAIVESIRNNICGLDINPIACVLCQINIQYALFPLLEIIRNKKSNFVFPLFKILNQNAIEFIPPELFDYVVGNPPYVFIRDIPENQRKIIENSTLESIKGQYDLYQLFIEIGIKILKQAGFLGYIIPDSLLALSNRDVIRRYIYNNAKILEIVQIGPQFEDPVVSNVIILLQKEDELNERKSNIMKITQSNSEKAIMLKQDLIERWNYQFLININSKDIEIMEFLENSQPTLEDISLKPEFRISIFRGVELGKEGMIFYCDNCFRLWLLTRDDYQSIKIKVVESKTGEFSENLHQESAYFLQK